MMSSNNTDCLYEYAVIRYLPRVERGEFVNVGLIMMCKRRKWLRVEVNPPMARIALMNAPHDEPTLRRQLSQFEKIASGNIGSGEMGGMPVEERYRWLTAVRSTCIQTSPSHPGITADLDMTFSRLMEELVN